MEPRLSPTHTLLFSAKCSNCRWSRRFGYAKLTAETKSTSHAMRCHHSVMVTVSKLTTLENEIHAIYDHTHDPQIGEETPF